MDKLLAIDLSNLVIRHAANPYRTDTDEAGASVGGAAGALNQIITITQEIRPTHLLLAKDGHRSNIFRTSIDAAYKAHRPEATDEIKHNFATIYKALDILGWPVLSQDTYEADDIMASSARSFHSESMIVSGDKDLLALCDDKITVRLLQRGGYLDCGKKECEDIFGIPPELVCDYKALVGDQSDGIKGVAGIGPKRALGLLENYRDLNGIVAAAESLRPDELLLGTNKKITESVRTNLQSAKTSYELAKIIEDLQIDFDALSCPDMTGKTKLSDTDTDTLKQFGLGAITNRLNGVKNKPAPKAKMDLGKVFENAIS